MPSPPLATSSLPLPALAVRGMLGGTLMGLANLVPGISGGTMLLAAGVYPDFITAIAEVTTLRLRRHSLVLLAAVLASAAVAILLLAGPIKELVVTRRWIMYSLFVGLTLGGLPAIWRLAVPTTRALAWGTVAGLLAMIALTLARTLPVAGSLGSGPLLLGVAGLAGASAMILPGVSGGFLLLLLGQYVPILGAIDAVKDGLAARQPAAVLDPALGVLLPVAIGVAIGTVGVANGLRWLLVRYPQPTLGVLMGLLLGAVVGLWPFQHSVEPTPGETVIKGELVTAERLAEIDPEDYPTAYFTPSPLELLIALILVFTGAAATVLISRFGATARATVEASGGGQKLDL